MFNLDFKQLIQWSMLIVVAVATIILAFISGMIFQANFYAPAQGSVSAAELPTLSAGPQAVPQLPTEAISTPEEFATFWEAWSFLNEQFYGDIPADQERVYGAIKGMVSSFDDQHTSFIDPVRAAIIGENMQGSFSGIGATVRLDEAGRLIIVDPMMDQPAFQAGLRPDDMVLAIDGQSIEGLSLYEAVSLIRGPTGSTVVVTILREDEPEPFDVSIVRAKIELEVVEARLIEEAEEIGYVRLTQFSNGASEKVAEAIEELLAEGATAIVFDLRSNPGGLLSEAVNVSSLFIEKGPVVIEKLKGGEEKVFEVKRSRKLFDMPLVILVNGGSASASEIVAGAIQDTARASVIGEQTFGKGSVQLPHHLSDGSELRVTIAEWLTPSARQIHGKGITPDIIVEMEFDEANPDSDPQLAEAVEFLSNQNGPRSYQNDSN